jgi:glycine cleavage system H protein
MWIFCKVKAIKGLRGGVPEGTSHKESRRSTRRLRKSRVSTREEIMTETYYSKEHEWVKVKEEIATFGITSYAANQLGDITYVELPRVGSNAKQFEVLCSIESVKAASDIYAPVSGKVVKVNDALENTPEIVNESAEESGWLACIEMADMKEIGSLMNIEEYEDYVRGLE